MAKKIKLNSNSRVQPGLFDDFGLPGGLFDEIPVHPSIEDFAVTACAAADEESEEEGNPLTQPIDGIKPRDVVFFVSFGSGSSGNSAFIGTNTGGLLIDAGVDLTRVSEGLRANGFSMRDVKGIILTHDHSDHVHYVYTLVRRNPHIRVYCTPKAFGGIMRRHSISRRLKDYHVPIYKEFPFQVAGFEITAFEVSHDGTDNAGFFITRPGYEDFSLAVATDLGCINDRVDHYMRQASHIVIESNYDAEMLRNGPYPAHLKARIVASSGHLDNEVAAAFIGSIAGESLRNVFLCHLSHENNTPDIALSAMKRALEAAGSASMTEVLPRMTPSRLFTLRND